MRADAALWPTRLSLPRSRTAIAVLLGSGAVVQEDKKSGSAVRDLREVPVIQSSATSFLRSSANVADSVRDTCI